MPRQQISYEYQSATATTEAIESPEDSLASAWRRLTEYDRRLSALNVASSQPLSYSTASNEDVKREAKANGGFSKWIQKIESG